MIWYEVFRIFVVYLKLSISSHEICKGSNYLCIIFVNVLLLIEVKEIIKMQVKAYDEGEGENDMYLKDVKGS